MNCTLITPIMIRLWNCCITDSHMRMIDPINKNVHFDQSVCSSHEVKIIAICPVISEFSSVEGLQFFYPPIQKRYILLYKLTKSRQWIEDYDKPWGSLRIFTMCCFGIQCVAFHIKLYGIRLLNSVLKIDFLPQSIKSQ